MVNGRKVKPFLGVKQFNLTGISAGYFLNEGDYTISCKFGGKKGISLFHGYFKLNGLWEYSGFKNYKANCSSTNPLDCTGMKLKEIKWMSVPQFPGFFEQTR